MRGQGLVGDRGERCNPEHIERIAVTAFFGRGELAPSRCVEAKDARAVDDEQKVLAAALEAMPVARPGRRPGLGDEPVPEDCEGCH